MVKSLNLASSPTSRNSRLDYFVITPVKDEESLFPHMATSMIEQTHKPLLWLILIEADDASRDHAEEVASKHPWISVNDCTTGIRDPHRRMAKIITEGIENAGQMIESLTDNFKFLSKCDADIILPPNYFEFLIDRMSDDERIGMASVQQLQPIENISSAREGRLEAVKWAVPIRYPDLPWDPAVIWRKACYDDIGGVAIGPSHDSVEVVLAQSKGWKTQIFDGVLFKHVRPPGYARGFFDGFSGYGRAAHYLGLPGWLALLKAGHLTLSRHPTKGLGYLAGYTGAWLRRLDRCPHQVVLDHYRNERWQRIKKYRRRRGTGGSENGQEPKDQQDNA